MAKIINAVFGGGLFATTAKVFQYDVGDKLRFLGVDLPAGYSVDFANSRTGASTTVYGDADGVEIPPAYFIPGTDIYAWVVISDADGHYTRYQAKIPIYERASRTSVEPTPAQADALDEAINALNSAVEDVEDIASGIPDQINAALEEAKASGDFDGPPGPQGPAGPTGESGTPGNSIWRGGAVRASGTTPYYFLSDLSGRTDVSPSAGDLIVSNIFWLWQIKRISGQTVYLTSLGSIKGETGADGEDGYSPTVTVTEISGGHRVTITDAEGDHTFDVMDGQGGGGDDEVFFAIYGETTSAQIEAAYQNGKAVFCIDGEVILPLSVRVGPTTHSFSGCYGKSSLWMIDCDSDTWDFRSDDVYSKPLGGIPASDLASAVQTSLGKADTALQSYTETDPTVPSWAKASSKPSYTASEVGAIAAPASPTSGDVLTYDGSAWGASAPSHQIPSGGNAGECLAKKSSSDYDLKWRTINDWTPAGLMRTAGGTAAKVAEWSFWSATQYPAWLVVTVGNSNTYAGAITLKVNGSTVYPIYINGAASSATNYTLPAGSYFVYFDGSKFDFRTDGKLPGDIIGHADKDIAAPASPSTGDFLCWNGSAWAATTLAAWQGGNY